MTGSRVQIEDILMAQLGVSYGEARKLALQGRESLKMGKFEPWNNELVVECQQLQKNPPPVEEKEKEPEPEVPIIFKKLKYKKPPKPPKSAAPPATLKPPPPPTPEPTKHPSEDASSQQSTVSKTESAVKENEKPISSVPEGGQMPAFSVEKPAEEEIKSTAEETRSIDSAPVETKNMEKDDENAAVQQSDNQSQQQQAMEPEEENEENEEAMTAAAAAVAAAMQEGSSEEFEEEEEEVEEDEIIEEGEEEGEEEETVEEEFVVEEEEEEGVVMEEKNCEKGEVDGSYAEEERAEEATMEAGEELMEEEIVEEEGEQKEKEEVLPDDDNLDEEMYEEEEDVYEEEEITEEESIEEEEEEVQEHASGEVPASIEQSLSPPSVPAQDAPSPSFVKPESAIPSSNLSSPWYSGPTQDKAVPTTVEDESMVSPKYPTTTSSTPPTQQPPIPPDLSTMSLSNLRAKKREVKKELVMYDINFKKNHGRMPEKTEKRPIRHLYEAYNALKDQISKVEKETPRAARSSSPSSTVLSQDSEHPVVFADDEDTDEKAHQLGLIPDVNEEHEENKPVASENGRAQEASPTATTQNEPSEDKNERKLLPVVTEKHETSSKEDENEQDENERKPSMNTTPVLPVGTAQKERSSKVGENERKPSTNTSLDVEEETPVPATSQTSVEPGLTARGPSENEQSRQTTEDGAVDEAEALRRQQLEKEIKEMEAIIAAAAATEKNSPRRKVVKRVVQPTSSTDSEEPKLIRKIVKSKVVNPASAEASVREQKSEESLTPSENRELPVGTTTTVTGPQLHTAATDGEAKTGEEESVSVDKTPDREAKEPPTTGGEAAASIKPVGSENDRNTNEAVDKAEQLGEEQRAAEFGAKAMETDQVATEATTDLEVAGKCLEEDPVATEKTLDGVGEQQATTAGDGGSADIKQFNEEQIGPGQAIGEMLEGDHGVADTGTKAAETPAIAIEETDQAATEATTYVYVADDCPGEDPLATEKALGGADEERVGMADDAGGSTGNKQFDEETVAGQAIVTENMDNEQVTSRTTQTEQGRYCSEQDIAETKGLGVEHHAANTGSEQIGAEQISAEQVIPGTKSSDERQDSTELEEDAATNAATKANTEEATAGAGIKQICEGEQTSAGQSSAKVKRINEEKVVDVGNKLTKMTQIDAAQAVPSAQTRGMDVGPVVMEKDSGSMSREEKQNAVDGEGRQPRTATTPNISNTKREQPPEKKKKGVFGRLFGSPKASKKETKREEEKRVTEEKAAAEAERFEKEGRLTEAEAKQVEKARAAAEKAAAEAKSRLEAQRLAVERAAAETKRLEDERRAAEAETEQYEKARMAAEWASAKARARLGDERAAAERAVAEAKRLQNAVNEKETTSRTATDSTVGVSSTREDPAETLFYHLLEGYRGDVVVEEKADKPAPFTVEDKDGEDHRLAAPTTSDAEKSTMAMTAKHAQTEQGVRATEETNFAVASERSIQGEDSPPLKKTRKVKKKVVRKRTKSRDPPAFSARPYRDESLRRRPATTF